MKLVTAVIRDLLELRSPFDPYGYTTAVKIGRRIEEALNSHEGNDRTELAEFSRQEQTYRRASVLHAVHEFRGHNTQ